MNTLVIASNYDQYKLWRKHHNYKTEDYQFVSRPEHLYVYERSTKVIILDWTGLLYGRANYSTLCQIARDRFDNVTHRGGTYEHRRTNGAGSL
jgi:hypothetical protein